MTWPAAGPNRRPGALDMRPLRLFVVERFPDNLQEALNRDAREDVTPRAGKHKKLVGHIFARVQNVSGSLPAR